MAEDIIVVQSRAGERDEAVAALFEAEYAKLVNTAFALVADWDLAGQLAQEAFLRLWRRWRWLRDPRAAPAYLRQTVLNLSRHSIRRTVLERNALARQAADRDRQDSADPAGDVALRQAIGTLSHRKRACVVLRYLVGLTEPETAGLLGVPVGTVQSQTHEALRQLAGGPAP